MEYNMRGDAYYNGNPAGAHGCVASPSKCMVRNVPYVLPPMTVLICARAVEK